MKKKRRGGKPFLRIAWIGILGLASAAVPGCMTIESGRQIEHELERDGKALERGAPLRYHASGYEYRKRLMEYERRKRRQAESGNGGC